MPSFAPGFSLHRRKSFTQWLSFRINFFAQFSVLNDIHALNFNTGNVLFVIFEGGDHLHLCLVRGSTAIKQIFDLELSSKITYWGVLSTTFYKLVPAFLSVRERTVWRKKLEIATNSNFSFSPGRHFSFCLFLRFYLLHDNLAYLLRDNLGENDLSTKSVIFLYTSNAKEKKTI